jgi:hypothetical protein
MTRNIRLLYRFLVVFTLTAIVSGQELSETKEQELKLTGGYVTKAMLFIPVPVIADNSISALRQDQKESILYLLKDRLVCFGGMEYINLDDAVYAPLRGKIESADSVNASFCTFLDTYILPPLIAKLEETLIARTLEIQSEQQRNSFISDKTKSSAHTDLEIARVYNAMYIALPVLYGYELKSLKDDYYSAKIGTGLSIYHVIVSDSGNSHVEFVKYAADSSSGLEVKDKTRALMNAAHYSTEFCVDQLSELPDFNIRTQVISRGFFTIPVWFSAQQAEAVFPGNIFRMYKTIEKDSLGTLEKKKAGWVMLRGKSNEFQDGTTEYKARVISGIPEKGMVLEQIKRRSGTLNIGTSFRPLYFYGNADTLFSETDSLGNNATLAIDGLDHHFLMLSPRIGVSNDATYRNTKKALNLYLNFDLCIFRKLLHDIGSIHYIEKNEYLSLNRIKGIEGFWSIGTKAFIRRLGFMPEIGFTLGAWWFEMTPKNYSLGQVQFSILGGLNESIALTPSVSLNFYERYALYTNWLEFSKDTEGGSEDYNMHSQNKSLKMNISGLQFGIAIQID